MDSPWSIGGQILLHFTLLSLMAIGGGVVALSPEMMRFMTETHQWVSHQVFVEAFTLAQVAPGPNFLFATIVGYRAAGVIGAAAATVALVGPPSLLAVLALRYGNRLVGQSFGTRVRLAVMPLSIGMMAATSWSLTLMAVQTVTQIGLFAAAVAVLVWTRLNPLWLIAVGGVLGALKIV